MGGKRKSKKRPWRLVEDATGQIHGTFGSYETAEAALDEWAGRDCSIMTYDFTIKRRR
jgi:hypothetical protein